MSDFPARPKVEVMKGRFHALAITLECPHPKIKLIAENIAGAADVSFVKPGAPGTTKADAETKAKTDAETDAENKAKADITRQQNEVSCAGTKCTKDAPAPTSVVTEKGTATFTLNNDRSGVAHGTAKATGHGTVECKKP